MTDSPTPATTPPTTTADHARLDRAAAAARWQLPRILVHQVRPGAWQVGWYLVDREPRSGRWQVHGLVRSNSAWGEPVKAGPTLWDSDDPEGAVADAACRALEEAIAAATEDTDHA